jgi:MraZ protein
VRAQFIGRDLHTIDPKNRLFIPPRFRRALQEEGKNYFVLTTVLGDCLLAYLPSEWEKVVERLSQENAPNKAQQRAFIRHLMANAAEVEVDGQGRLLVPQLLKDKTGLKREVYVIGAANKIEVWDKKKWDALEKRTMGDLKAASETFQI